MSEFAEEHVRQLRGKALLALDEWNSPDTTLQWVLTKFSLERGCGDETMEWFETLRWPGPKKDAALAAVIEWHVANVLFEGELEMLLSDPYPPIRLATLVELGESPKVPPPRKPHPWDYLRQPPASIYRR